MPKYHVWICGIYLVHKWVDIEKCLIIQKRNDLDMQCRLLNKYNSPKYKLFYLAGMIDFRQYRLSFL